jgi:hypothetical protein
MDWTGWAPWLSYGKFIPGRVWEFDKARIRHELETNLYRFRHCPHLRFDFIDAVIKAIPDTVKVEGSMDWEFSRGYEQTPGSLKIVEKNDAFGFTTVREYYADGVRPKGVKALEKILRQALSEVRRQDITPGLLMSP